MIKLFFHIKDISRVVAYLLLDCLQCLVRNKADANVKNLKGWTPLAETVSYGSRTASKFWENL